MASDLISWLLAERRRWDALSALVLALGALWVIVARAPVAPTAPAAASPRAGFAAPDFTLADLGGAPLALADQRGQVLIINHWASWCGPCRAEMPALQRLYAAERGRGLQILAVNSTVQDSAAAAAAFAGELGLSFPILLDQDGAVGRAYGVRALPSTFIVDRRGVIRSVLYGGPLSEASLRAAVEPLLAEAP